MHVHQTLQLDRTPPGEPVSRLCTLQIACPIWANLTVGESTSITKAFMRARAIMNCHNFLPASNQLTPFLHTNGRICSQASVIASGEAVCSVPNTLVAICLNTGGLAKVSESGALDCFIPILTSRKYLKALQGDTPSVLGAGLDELLRHVTSLRKNGVSMILEVFRVLCAEGGV